MIEYIRGEIVELSPAQMVIECAGIGYGLNISLTTYSAFDKRREGKVYVHEVIREDAHLLFGFASREERELFLLLTSVSGVGPNTARMILSSLKPSDLIDVIASGDDVSLTAIKNGTLRYGRRSRGGPCDARFPESGVAKSSRFLAERNTGHDGGTTDQDFP